MTTIKSFTNIEQATQLVDLGVDPETADMYWKKSPVIHQQVVWIPHVFNKLPILFEEEDLLPCWSVGALINMMPQTNKFHTKLDIEHNRVTFEPIDDDIVIDETTFHYSDGATLLDACVDMIEWLLKNKRGYLA